MHGNAVATAATETIRTNGRTVRRQRAISGRGSRGRSRALSARVTAWRPERPPFMRYVCALAAAAIAIAFGRHAYAQQTDAAPLTPVCHPFAGLLAPLD